MNKVVPLEELAARALSKAMKGRSLKGYLEREYKRLGIPDKARPVLMALVSNVARRWMLLAYALGYSYDAPPKSVSKWLDLVVAYQALFRKKKYEELKVQKLPKEVYAELLRTEPGELARSLGEEGDRIYRSVPKWVWRELKRFGDPRSFVDSLDLRDFFWVRVRDLKALKTLEKLGFEVLQSDLPDVFKVKGPMRLLITKRLHPKRLVIMEKASATVAHLVEGKRVLDLTSAPGGKALHAHDLGYVVIANDLDPKRFAFKAIERVASDARLAPFRGAFDTVILDPDCTGLGRLHSPETRIWLSMTDKKKMAEYQAQLISSSVKYLRRGGRLIYSTCTVTFDENEGHEELMNELGLEPLEVPVASPGLLRGWRRFLPQLHGTIGFSLSVRIKSR